MKHNSHSSSRTHRRSGQALLGLLAAVAILVILSSIYLGRRTDSEGKVHKNVYLESMDQAKGVELDSNLNQIRQGIRLYKNDHDGQVPASMADLRAALHDYPAEMWVNPVDKKPLIYDPTTGSIYADGQTPPAPRGGAGAPGSPATPDAAVPGAPAPAAPAPAAPASPAGPSTGMPGVPNPSDITSKIPQPGAGAEAAAGDTQ